MIPYKGKAKCSCSKRAKWKADRNVFACDEHKHRLKGLDDPAVDSGRMTEADRQTWGRL